MDFNAIIKRVINIITKTNDEWDAIKSESLTIQDIYFKFAIIVYAIPSAALLIGMILQGAPIMMSLVMAIFLYAFTIGVLFLIGLLIDVIGPQFGGTKDMISSQTLAVFSLVPYAVISVLFILPFGFGGFGFGGGFFYIVLLVSLFSFYLMFIGAPKLKNISQQDKIIPFVIIMAIIWLILIYIDFRLSAEIAFRAFIGSIRAGF